MTASALGRVIERGAADRGQLERCDMCACTVPERHRHAVNTQQEAELMCLCRPCALLFERDAASQGHYRLVPERRVRLDGLTPAALGVPVGLAYFVRTPGARSSPTTPARSDPRPGRSTPSRGSPR